jgi:hypothetical protein
LESPLLDREIGIQIDLSGLDRFMPEPQGDDAPVVARLEELDGRGVA